MNRHFKMLLLMAAAALLLSGCMGWGHSPGHGYRNGYPMGPREPCPEQSPDRDTVKRPPC